MTVPVPVLRRVGRSEPATERLQAQLSNARHHLIDLREHAARHERATVALVDEVRWWKAAALEAEASREEYERALALARETASAAVAEAQARAAQIVERARAEAEDLVNRARIDARRAVADERRELRSRAAAVAEGEERLATQEEALEAERVRLGTLAERWRRETAWLGARLLRAAAPLPRALPAESETELDEAEPVGGDEVLLADPDVDRHFARFMSSEIEEEPSRQWMAAGS